MKPLRITLDGRQLVLRPLETDDLPALLKVFQDEEVVRFIFKGTKYEKDQFDELKRKYMLRPSDDPFGIWPIVDTQTSLVLGCAGITSVDYLDEVAYEFGIALAKQYQRQGIGKRVCEELIRYGENLGLPFLIATCHPDDEVSRKLMHRLPLIPINQNCTFHDRGKRDVWSTIPSEVQGVKIKESECTWPEEPSKKKDIDEIISKVCRWFEIYRSPLATPISYPGTTPLTSPITGPDTYKNALDAFYTDGPKKLLRTLIQDQINLIGTHSHWLKWKQNELEFKPEGESGFSLFQQIEAKAIAMIADVVGGKPGTVDGFFCGGATEANLQGMWIGREWLRYRPDPMNRGIVVLTTPLTHYSIVKAAEILDIGRSQRTTCPICFENHILSPDHRGCGVCNVGMERDGTMSITELEKSFALKFQEGFRRFLIVPTVGTTATGSVDPVTKISEFVTDKHRNTSAHCYIHVDAAFGGFTVPFSEEYKKEDYRGKIGFENSNVMSLAMDADKMGQMPYPAGIFLCRKDMQLLVSRRVNYIRGHEDDTVSGSRTAVTSILAYIHYRRIGRRGQRDYVARCLELRNKLKTMIEDRFPPVDSAAGKRPPIEVWPNCESPYVNMLSFVINAPSSKAPYTSGANPSYNHILERWHLRSELVPSVLNDVNSCPRKVYKIIVMPHITIGKLQYFFNDICRIADLVSPVSDEENARV